MNPIALRLHETGLLLEGTHLYEIVCVLDIAEREINRLEEASAEMRRQHAEEIERLKAQFASSNLSAEVLSGLVTKYRKQAERYEKLRRLSRYDARRLFWGLDAAELDVLVDQLPASGEAQK